MIFLRKGLTFEDDLGDHGHSKRGPEMPLPILISHPQHIAEFQEYLFLLFIGLGHFLCGLDHCKGFMEPFDMCAHKELNHVIF